MISERHQISAAIFFCLPNVKLERFMEVSHEHPNLAPWPKELYPGKRYFKSLSVSRVQIVPQKQAG